MTAYEKFIAIDTETTGLDAAGGDKLVEIGGVEMEGLYETGRRFHTYINPYPRQVDPGALAVHGLSNQFLMDKPKFRHVAQDFLDYIGDLPLVIHNAPFDKGFLNTELKNIGKPEIKNVIIDSLQVARSKFPGSKVSLDALCARFGIDASDRTLHGALIDSILLGQAFVKLTERDKLNLTINEEEVDEINIQVPGYDRLFRPSRGVIMPTHDELVEHQTFVAKKLDNALWLNPPEEFTGNTYIAIPN